ncbi:MAG: hypothetical protein QJR12_03350 [Mycobacterium sp.]|uniref:hypothetical protein n=1 Tax=Mycobacterium sp. TaxID=1785 RepID=UPI0026036CAA|nr:hypothetical protein [Mycobacterium sp.]MDI3313340.1 hypothetical protein [Mycobacterium sp.]
MSAPTTNRPAAGVFSPRRAPIAQPTLRTDRWWLAPLMTDIGLAAFLIYGFIRSMWGSAYWVPDYHYLSPFYSPCISASCQPGASHLGVWLGHFPWWIPLGMLVLPFLLAFRITCYYYRKAYYRSVWQSPTSCAIPEPRVHYTGETRLPLIIQNSHRYFFFFALIVSVINTYDAIVAFHSPSGFGLGLGSVIIVGNVILLWIYTLSCHSCRHVMGGRLKHFSSHPIRYWLWTQISRINTRHMTWAWITLGTLVLTDFYIMLVASGTIHDLRFIG